MSRSGLSPRKQDNACKRIAPHCPKVPVVHAQGKVLKPPAPDAQVGNTKAEAGSEISREATACLGPHHSRVCTHVNPKAYIYLHVCDASSLLCQQAFVFKLQLGVSYCHHPHVFSRRETSHLPFLMSPAEYGNQAVRGSQKALQRNVSNLSSAFPRPESRGGPGRPAFPRGLLHGLLPPTGTLGSPGAARGAALITDGDPPNSADLESFVFRSPGQPVALRSASLWAGLRLTSVPFCFERETGAGRTCLTLAAGLLLPERGPWWCGRRGQGSPPSENGARVTDLLPLSCPGL